MAKPRRGSSTSSDGTKARIVAATIETLRDEGIVGLSARAIARRGEFNQALIYYHFGSVTDAVVAGIEQLSQERIERYRARLEDMGSFTDIAVIAGELHREDMEAGNMTVLTQVLAGSAADQELRARLMAPFEPWNRLVEEAVHKVVDRTPFAGVISVEDVAYAASSLFIGIELFTYLDPDEDREASLFSTIEAVARLVDLVLQTGTLPGAEPD